ncbi:2,5-diamino-6-ribosylamino-4(3H)-pyrimidinone 5'-phosphate reductase [Candidatus Nitrosocosmicus oleophilus]|jgi:2,5-diamino-6-(ribosylamino)-4(3H)-pyrimidinone 5'-phosphate reductase|uniref:2,5-diamino-6-ribosylamino-4(3H)-pyrimidinone 5'-phosphate reductase n=1 Tax=Candidatus Nitrosocosmicus oleophilus TaxID=1353260 RepID=A0A654M268_9ARCH|nr:dihydrofolate reductase family protein [Candidatus Nitrosocosmicus oleophilus]ALI37924.1 2,5-diamino-6-ribosylamino-4(3H)-pyrimidinone 5'-phosphate reductase [Candidatus Nitrosocosmicus oleophilus]
MKIILNAATSIDGKIATVNGDTKISSVLDLKRVHGLRRETDVILVGISTVINDDPLLTIRYGMNKKGTKNPIRIIIDSKARIPLHSKIVKTANQIETRLVVTSKAPSKNLKKLEERGLKIIVLDQGTKEDRENRENKRKDNREKVDLKKLFNQLEKEGISNVLVEGGGEINWSIIKDNLFDEMIITISPLIIGGKRAISLVGGEGYKTINESVKIKLSRIQKKSNGEIILYYKNIKTN